MFFGVSENKRDTYMKIIVKLPEETVLGMHVVGMGADEMI